METYGDFCGFTFNEVHSSSLALVRVSNGSRYEDRTIPNFRDMTVDVPGGDGTYFFDSNYSSRQFSIRVAFDSMTESQYRQFRQVFNGKSMGKLIFDELPYKAYIAKVQEPPQLNTICFDSAEGRVYKGEGSINFICYNPFARSVDKWLQDYDVSNKDEWKEASGMLDSAYDAVNSRNYDDVITPTDSGDPYAIFTYNPGDLDTDWELEFVFSTSTDSIPSCSLSLIQLYTTDTSPELVATMSFNEIIAQSVGTIYDNSFKINSKTQLIEGYDVNGKRTGHLYNGYLAAGDFFKIPLGKHSIRITGAAPSSIEYNYLYY